MVKFLQGHKAAEDGVYIHNSHHSVSYDPGLSLKQVLDCVLFWFYPHRKSTMQVLVLLTFCGWEGWDSKLAPSARVKLTSTSKTAFNHSPVVFKVFNGTPGQQCQLYLGACEIDKFSGPAKSLLKQKLRASGQSPVFQEPLQVIWSLLTSKHHVSTQTHLPGIHGSSLSPGLF